MPQEKTPHVHHDLIIAWAKGEKIEVMQNVGLNAGKWFELPNPTWSSMATYRIKPKPPVHRWRWVMVNCSGYMVVTSEYLSENELKGRFPAWTVIQKVDSTLQVF